MASLTLSRAEPSGCQALSLTDAESALPEPQLSVSTVRRLAGRRTRWLLSLAYLDIGFLSAAITRRRPGESETYSLESFAALFAEPVCLHRARSEKAQCVLVEGRRPFSWDDPAYKALKGLEVRKQKSKSPAPKVEEDPDAWERFESAVDSVMKGGPQHRPPAQKPEPSGEDRK